METVTPEPKARGLIIAPILAVVLFLLLLANAQPPALAITAGVALWCAIWWVLETVPIAVTSLVPIALFPLLGVLSPKAVAGAYGSPIILLLLGGFIVSAAMQHSGAHKQVALAMLRVIGTHSKRRLILGFMLASATLSMWISNTATTVMLLPVAMAVLEGSRDRQLGVALLLGIAYAASIGGIATPVGTPPNLIFMQVYAENTGREIDFVQWMGLGLPVVALFLPLCAWWLSRRLRGASGIVPPQRPGWRPAESRVLWVLGITALLWITRKPPLLGWSTLPGLTHANDAAVALLAAISVFVIPDGAGGRLLNWQRAARIPWGVLLLFGGGLTLAKAFDQSGLSAVLGAHLALLSALPVWLMIALVCLGVTFLTEMTSNTATTALLMPVLAAAALGANVEPALLMAPAAISASCAFMLPVATGPNAVIYAGGNLTVRDMTRNGLVLNLIGVVVVTAVALWRLT